MIAEGETGQLVKVEWWGLGGNRVANDEIAPAITVACPWTLLGRSEEVWRKKGKITVVCG